MKLIIFYIIFTGAILGQNYVDSLLTLISASKSDQEKIEYYNKLAWHLRSNKPVKALEYADSAIALSKKIKKPELLSKTYNFLGVIYRNKGELLKATEFYNKALENALKYKDSTQIAYSYNNLGGIYKLRGNSPLALDYMLKALKYFEATDNKSGIGFCTINLATLYRREGDFASALKYLDRCLEVRKELNYQHGIALALYQKALIQKLQGKFKEALDSFNEVLKIFKKINDVKGIAVAYEAKGEILYELEDYKTAKKDLLTAVKLSAELEDKVTLSRAYFKLAIVSLVLHDKNEAFEFLEKAEKIISTLNIPAKVLEELKYKALFYEILEDYKTSLVYYKKYYALKDSIYSVENKEKVASIQAAYNKEKSQVLREQENANLRKELELKRTQRFYAMIVFILIILLALIILWKYSSTRKLAVKLKEAVVTKDKFMKILAHDLRNPINTTMGFLQLLKSDGEKMSVDERKQIIDYANNSINKNSLLLENLLEWNNLLDKNSEAQIERHKINEIFLETIKIMQPLADAKNIQLKYEFSMESECLCDLNMARTILRNFLNNAIKFTNSGGEIVVRAEDENDRIKISVEDNGIGIPEEHQKTIFDFSSKYSAVGTQSERGSGLGLMLCKEYAEMNKGEIGFTSKVNIGSTFWFTLPKT